jgi:hypothetical protein
VLLGPMTNRTKDEYKPKDDLHLYKGNPLIPSGGATPCLIPSGGAAP